MLQEFNPFKRSDSIFGMDIIEAPVKLVPKLRVHDSVQLSDAFREEMNNWLLERFGSYDASPIPKGMVYMFGNTVIMRPETVAMMNF